MVQRVSGMRGVELLVRHLRVGRAPGTSRESGIKRNGAIDRGSIELVVHFAPNVIVERVRPGIRYHQEQKEKRRDGGGSFARVLPGSSVPIRTRHMA